MERLFRLKKNGTTVGRETIAGSNNIFCHGVYYRDKPNASERIGDGMGRGIFSHHYRLHHRHFDHGPGSKRTLRAGAGNGVKRVFCLHGVLHFRLHLAAGAFDGISLRSDQYPDNRHQNPQIYHPGDPIKPAKRHWRRNRHFVAYIGLLNVGIIRFDSGVPALATLDQPAFWLFLIGLALTVVLLVCRVKGAILIGMVAPRR